MNETIQPWDRLPDEPEVWYNRLAEYLRLGRDRSIREVWKAEQAGLQAVRLVSPRVLRGTKGDKGRHGKQNSSAPPRPTRHWYEAAKKWRWDERARAWDIYLRAEEEREWIERRRAYRAERWELKEKLLTKVKGMLNFPLTQVRRSYEETDPVTGEKQTITQIIEPVDWRLRDVGPLIRAMDLLMENDFTDGADKPEQPESGDTLSTLLEAMVSATYEGIAPPGTDPMGDESREVPGSGGRPKKFQDRAGETDTDNR